MCDEVGQRGGGESSILSIPHVRLLSQTAKQLEHPRLLHRTACGWAYLAVIVWNRTAPSPSSATSAAWRRVMTTCQPDSLGFRGNFTFQAGRVS